MGLAPQSEPTIQKSCFSLLHWFLLRNAGVASHINASMPCVCCDFYVLLVGNVSNAKSKLDTPHSFHCKLNWRSRFHEFKPKFGPTIVCGFAQLGTGIKGALEKARSQWLDLKRNHARPVWFKHLRETSRRPFHFEATDGEAYRGLSGWHHRQ